MYWIPKSIVASAVLVSVAIVMLCVALGTADWLENLEGNVTLGLFQMCVHDWCIAYGEASKFGYHYSINLRVTQGLCIASLIFYLVTAAVLTHLICFKRMLVVSKSHGFASLFFAHKASILLSFGIWRFIQEHYHQMTSHPLHWYFGHSIRLAYASWVFGVIAGPFAMYGVRQLYKQQHPPGLFYMEGFHQPAINCANVPVDFGHPAAPENTSPQNPIPHPENAQKPQAY